MDETKMMETWFPIMKNQKMFHESIYVSTLTGIITALMWTTPMFVNVLSSTYNLPTPPTFNATEQYLFWNADAMFGFAIFYLGVFFGTACVAYRTVWMFTTWLSIIVYITGSLLLSNITDLDYVGFMAIRFIMINFFLGEIYGLFNGYWMKYIFVHSPIYTWYKRQTVNPTSEEQRGLTGEKKSLKKQYKPFFMARVFDSSVAPVFAILIVLAINDRIQTNYMDGYVYEMVLLFPLVLMHMIGAPEGIPVHTPMNPSMPEPVDKKVNKKPSGWKISYVLIVIDVFAFKWFYFMSNVYVPFHMHQVSCSDTSMKYAMMIMFFGWFCGAFMMEWVHYYSCSYDMKNNSKRNEDEEVEGGEGRFCCYMGGKCMMYYAFLILIHLLTIGSFVLLMYANATSCDLPYMEGVGFMVMFSVMAVNTWLMEMLRKISGNAITCCLIDAFCTCIGTLIMQGFVQLSSSNQGINLYDLWLAPTIVSVFVCIVSFMFVGYISAKDIMSSLSSQVTDSPN